MTNPDNQISRRSAMGLAAVLAATVVTAAVAGSSLLHWRTQARPHAAPTQAQVVQTVHAPAPAAQIDD
jgi:hypothetical protein